MAGPLVGKTIYYCERCGSLLIVGGVDEVEVFHASPMAPKPVGIDQCPGWDRAAVPTLKSRLDEMHERDYERLKDI
jgi:hypothetical protein